ncbi:hypothetical protein [Candidatus Odyssella acanthamoebae]|uniref:Uncharacterized protein n=1 Tax=Candidatus Odyssella acanthamoebae TaxID=91604 RepID=A0A077AT87_9PROT|nr:hypothetical protein [Candidatus Paracaedibacter acanthamoebae]AIK95596.1 hypothetical protein ID47_00710 [Candidatus Paracaedibacter acanthamoebae]
MMDDYKIQVEANQISLEGTQEELTGGSKILLDVLKLIETQRAVAHAQRKYYLTVYQLLFLMGDLTARSQQLKVDYADPADHNNAIQNRL